MKRTHQSSRKNTTKQRTDSQPIRCRIQNTGNQDAHRIGWIWSRNRGRSEGPGKWNKEKCTGNQQWWEGNQDSNQWLESEERNKHSTSTEFETRIQKNENQLRNLWDNVKRSNIRIIGVPEGEDEEQEIKNLFEKIMKENFPNLARETDFQEVQEAQSPKELGPKEAHTKDIIITLLQIIYYRYGENLKSSKRKGESCLQRSSHKAVSWFLKRNPTGKKG